MLSVLLPSGATTVSFTVAPFSAALSSAHTRQLSPVTRFHCTLLAIANAVNIKRNGKAIAWLYQNTGNILDYKDGDKVKFDLTAIQNDPDWPILRQDYKDFILSNADTVFTLEFEPRFRKNHTLACLKEDPVTPKRLFWVGHLIKQREPEQEAAHD